ncbi:protein of unknown function [Candidatus Promineifilum breve]|uniref:Uncharacterized protein n=1 Tax=Candidatus Promineifilum breve TaxID=1806508 RepID=A0A170PHH2_9CHLR|nr:protein of unknown function [Candidatus Promineifilum breve]
MFQYPLSGRRLCSSRRRAAQRPIVRVSVPSIGSKAVQRTTIAITSPTTASFSTLYRVEGCAAQLRQQR